MRDSNDIMDKSLSKSARISPSVCGLEERAYMSLGIYNSTMKATSGKLHT